MDEIKRPSLIEPTYNRSRRPAAERDSAPHALANLQVRFAIDAQDALDIHDQAFAAKQYGQTTKSKAPAFRGEFLEARAQRSVILEDPNVANHASSGADVSARLTF
jgi:hypothetical protein